MNNMKQYSVEGMSDMMAEIFDFHSSLYFIRPKYFHYTLFTHSNIDEAISFSLYI